MFNVDFLVCQKSSCDKSTALEVDASLLNSKKMSYDVCSYLTLKLSNLTVPYVNALFITLPDSRKY